MADMVPAIAAGYDGGTERSTSMPRGGKREGTGRKKKFGEETINVSARIPLRLKEKLEATARSTSRSMSDVLVDLIEQMPSP